MAVPPGFCKGQLGQLVHAIGERLQVALLACLLVGGPLEAAATRPVEILREVHEARDDAALSRSSSDCSTTRSRVEGPVLQPNAVQPNESRSDLCMRVSNMSQDDLHLYAVSNICTDTHNTNIDPKQLLTKPLTIPRNLGGHVRVASANVCTLRLFNVFLHNYIGF